MKVLLAGMGQDSARIVGGVLGARGHEQLVAARGARALELAEAHSPELIIVDDDLGDMTAAEFCRRTRARAQGVDAVILVITNHNSELPAVLDAGATDFHTTALGPAALETRVLIAERLVQRHAHLRDREARFRRLFESGVAGVTIADLDGNFKEANEAFLHMLGYTQADTIGGKLNWGTITPLDRLVPDSEAREQLRATGFLPLREREYVHKDGHHVAALVGSAMLDGTNECISYVADISERKRIELALRTSEEQYRILFEHSPFVKFLYDQDTLRILAVNEAAVHNYGYSRAEFLEMTLANLRPEEDRAKFLAHMSTVNHDPGSATPGVWRHRKKDGSVVDVDITVQKFSLGQVLRARRRARRDRAQPHGAPASPVAKDGGHRQSRRRHRS